MQPPFPQAQCGTSRIWVGFLQIPMVLARVIGTDGGKFGLQLDFLARI
jgi:hypothetical protein